ncbi:MAG TPA: type II toxin-antitoxin system ParD family antitoxin [Rhizomicrobium sp.]|nr:type II toxin-antitoxin system ParD family antitoxin [Rhizomicrobium sp.]
MNVSLTPTLEKMVRQKVKSGLYGNASEVMREALRIMQESEGLRRARLKRLRGAIAEGDADIAAGRFTEIRDEDELEAFFAKL